MQETDKKAQGRNSWKNYKEQSRTSRILAKSFPKEDLELIGANRDEAIPYLRKAVEKAIKEKDNLDGEYMLHQYGIFCWHSFRTETFFRG